MIRRILLGSASFGMMMWLALAGNAYAVAVGDQLSGVSVQRLGGEGRLDAAQMAGKVSVINFWATWCEACKVEIAEMEQLLAPQASKGLNLAFVSLDKEPQKAIDWFRKNLKQPDAMVEKLYGDPSFAVADKLEVDSFPMTLVVGRDGRVIHIQRGFKEGDGTTEAIAKMTSSLLEADKGSSGS